MFAVVAPQAAFAQEDDVVETTASAQTEDVAVQEKITVTGSRIARSDFTAESPVSIVSGDIIASAGTLELAEILRDQPSVTSGGFNQSSNLSGGGAQSIDLRNLGADRVLTLINGRRVAKFADALQNESADLGFIPTAMIERVEILRDGASAAYGADAVTGVVNVILKDDFEGLELSGQYGISDYGDRETASIEAVMGASSERGNVVLSAQYQTADMVLQNQRDWAKYAVSGLYNFPSANEPLIVTGSGAHPGGTFNFSGGGRWCTLPSVFGGDEVTNVWGQVDANGNVVCPGQALANSSAFPNAINAGNRYDYAFVQNILGGQERWNATASGKYILTDNVNLFADFQYANRKSQSVLDGNPIFAGSGSVFFPGGWVVPANNPYNPFPGQSAQVTIRPTSTIGARNQDTDAQNFRISAGLEGTILDDRFNWELSLTQTETTSTTTTDSTFNLARAIRISDPTLCASDPLCVAALQPGSMGALDVYRPGNWSESEIAYMRQIATSTFKQDQTSINAFIAGDVFKLPAGEVGVAVGLEYREEGMTFRPDAVTEAGESVANQTFSTFGGFDTYEAFAEVNVPILKDAPLAQSLSLNLQGRVFDYSTFGSDSVYKVGLNWAPTNDVRVRATYGTSYRIPTLVDTFSGGTVGFQFITDPCDAGAINDNPTRLANCLAAGPLGVSAGFTQSAAQLPVLGGGDLADGTFDLGPEEGTTYTVGLVYTPDYIPGLNVSVDYYSIEVTNYISTTDIEGEVLDLCYDSVNLSDPACALFSRDPSSQQLSGLVQTPINRSNPLETAGFDWSAAYSFDLASLFGKEFGELALTHQGNYVTDYNLFPGIGNYASSSGSGAIPEYRLTFGADWYINDFRFTWNTRYTPEIDDTRYDGRNYLGYDVIEDHWQNDFRVQYDVQEDLRMIFGVNNVFNEDPPYAFATGNNTVAGLYGSAVVGRYFFGRVSKSF